MRYALTLALLVGGCWKDPSAGPPLGYETDVESCQDRRDNDRDGRVDCADTDCLALLFCAEIVPLIPPNEPDEDDVILCTNRIDDDNDGNFDCGDRTCSQFMELCCITEFTDEACSNGIDDDENGFADCADFSCSQGIFVTVCDVEAVCDDGRDDDDDGAADCLDCDCAASCGTAGTEGTVETCANGADDDCNGFTDCDDFGCSMSPDPAVRAVCDTGTAEPEDTLAACMDGVDNDGNGFTDCDDFACSGSGVPEIRMHCEALLEDTFERCIDNVDNNGNGFTDCNDFSCRNSFEFLDAARTRVRAPCAESGATPDLLERIRRTGPYPDDVAAENARLNCSDGMDNDTDGFVDCDDWDCNFQPLLLDPETGRRFCEERTGLLICR